MYTAETGGREKSGRVVSIVGPAVDQAFPMEDFGQLVV